MTIEKGKEWGHRARRPSTVVFAKDDVDLISQWQNNSSAPFVILGGDLHTSLGRPLWNTNSDTENASAQFLPVDILKVDVISDNASSSHDVITMYALSSVQIGSWLSRERLVCVSNCGFIGDYNIAPRAHPNDGEMDVVTINASIDWRQRLQARARARLGNHVPHPQIAMERGVEHSWTKESPRERLSVDGIEVKRWSSVHVSVIADACTVVV